MPEISMDFLIIGKFVFCFFFFVFKWKSRFIIDISDISMQCRYIGDISPTLSDFFSFFLFFANLIIDAQYRVRINRHPKYRRYNSDISRHFKPCSQGKSIGQTII